MEVVIDGIKYIPETDKTIEVNEKSYESVSNWLSNIHYSLLNEWMRYIKKGEGDSPEAKSLSDKIGKFEEYTKEFLGINLLEI